jgi:hypothetical protein
VGGTQLTPALSASSSQNVPFNFTSLTPSNTPFGLTLGGMVYLKPGYTLSYLNKSSYIFQFTVTDANLMVAASNLTVTVTEVYQPPVFVSTSINMQMNEGSLPGQVGFKLIPNQFGPGMIPSTVYCAATSTWLCVCVCVCACVCVSV